MTMEQLKLKIKGRLEFTLQTREEYSKDLDKARVDTYEFTQSLAMYNYYDGKAEAYETVLHDMGE